MVFLFINGEKNENGDLEFQNFIEYILDNKLFKK